MSDVVKAQHMMLDALREVHRQCGFENNAKDASEFLVAVLSAQSIIWAELAGTGTTIREFGGAKKMVRVTTQIFEDLIRKDMQDYMDRERKAPRH